MADDNNQIPEPAGLDEYLADTSTQVQSEAVAPIPAPQTPHIPEPSGLNEYLHEELQQDKYGTLEQQAKAGLEGAAQGLVGPLAPMAEQALGVKSEDILGRAEANPITHYGSEIAGLVAPALVSGGTSLAGRAVGTAAKFTQSGALGAIERLLPAAGETLASKIGTGAAKAAVDNMLISGSDEVSKLILDDPSQSSQTAMTNIGLSGLLGGVLGGTSGGVASLWEAKAGTKLGQFIEDFKGRINEHSSDIDPVTKVTEELGGHYNGIKSLADEVYGPQGIKAKDLAKSMPEMNPKIAEQSQEIASKLDEHVKKMINNQHSYPPRLIAKMQADLDAYASKVSVEGATSADMFNAAQDLKQTLQSYAKFDKFVKPVDESYDFVRTAKELSHDIRGKLEDSAVWGKAAKRQEAINKAFKEFLPALKDFEKRFTTEVSGERNIDAGKINTYLNQLGKPNAEIKQKMLENFLEASEKYKKVISDSHINLGMDSPIEFSPLNMTKATLEEQTSGARIADMFIKKGLGDLGGKGLGALLGGAAGHATGHGWLGALIGEHALGNFFSSILPGVAKSMVGMANSAKGFKAAVEYANNVVKGEQLLNRAAIGLFKADKEDLIPESRMPKEKDREKLQKILKIYQTNPEKIFHSSENSDMQHYLPNHDTALNEASSGVINYLSGIRADLDRKAPLDSKPVPSAVQLGEWHNALNVAEQPLIVLDKIKKGTLTAKDISAVSNMYPALYLRMQNKITAKMIDHMSKGKEIIPYKTRIGMSMFLGEALDTTMQPQSILASQNSSQVKKNEQPPQQQSPKGSPSSPALQKMSQSFATPLQSRAIHKQTK